jgi:hypothetical protein
MAGGAGRILHSLHNVAMAVVMTTGLSVVGVAVSSATQATPAYAYACNGQRSCTNPATGCSHTGVNEAYTSVPINGTNYTIFLFYSTYCRTIWGATYPANPFNGGTLDAKVDGAGEDTLNLPLNYDSWWNLNETDQLNDINLCGYAMGYGSDGHWHQTSCY